MTVLAASITTRSGKPLLSRQFTEITKDRVMELLSNFQGLVANISSDHTYVESEHVRYVYKPFDDYYLILVTNRQSNIIQDLSTLNLFSQTVNYYLNSFDEGEIFENAFEILSSFDEIIVMGNKEDLTISQVNTYLAMESHEEKIQEIIERNKETEANAERKRRAKEIARKEHERKMGMPSADDLSSHKFMGSNDAKMETAYNSYYSHASAAAQQSFLHSQQQQQQKVQDQQYSKYQGTSNAFGGSGMKLSGNNKQSGAVAARKLRPLPKEPEEDKPDNNGILISIKETVGAEISRDGSILSSELKGVLELRINDESLAHAKLQLTSNVNVSDKSFQFKTHPNIDKNSFLSSKALGLKSNDKAFPSNDQSLGVLRWRKVGTADDKSIVPLDISTWVTPSDIQEGVFDVTVELEINENYKHPLNEITFNIPIGTSNVSISDDNNDVNATVIEANEEEGVIIKVERIEPGSSGVFSFTIDSGSEETLFPMNVCFKNELVSEQSFTGVGISNIVSSKDDSEALPYDVISYLNAEDYLVV
ncbi:hypothetical protein Kpol_380p13 [Vanderwaltozyma polyspora DSM 70294]|uniref:Coatomer subunit delta n=1 Tax=Vanderwaltozyma polyspora (strain ATCC 22028 / DSM 70294 / BCRC 21397 / CBS 2163 / NBRC 10782 / NRRL Y-8283 / UCD 57-17) TaxID=436907 RepID=A7TS72_VANPO|nr:uncharacterized protein Kpol_380p13 [Vanderwaltozyma polyspora DSM 70294]EDO14894.1 hypothetical protein Kpol_380p13 [Vanderwaltozyma polyspora DSM 70294]